MKSVWIRKLRSESGEKKNGGNLLVFFGGFACDDGLLKIIRLPKNCDILMFCDYRGLDSEINPDTIFEGYSHIGVVAWSFGLGVAEQFKRLMSAANVKVAMCTSPYPIDAERGISRELFDRTLENLDEAGLAKFFRRVCGVSDLFKPSKKMRSAEEFRHELTFLGELLDGKTFDKNVWDFVLAGRQDKIFVPQNMSRAWAEKVIFFEGSHFDMNIFEVAFATAVRKRSAFEKSVESYDAAALVQRDVAEVLKESLLSQIEKNSANFGFSKIKNILEIGCGTGVLTKLTYPFFNSCHWSLNDESLLLCSRAAKFCGERAQVFCGDASRVYIGRGYDLILSSSCFQWIEFPTEFFQRLWSISSENSLLAFSTFGLGNFMQVNEITGRGLTYFSAEQIKDFLKRAGFEVLFIKEWTHSLDFDSPLDVLRHIKATGVNADFKSFWTPAKISAFSKEYLRRFPSEKKSEKNSSVKLDYNPIIVIARKIRK